MRIARFYFLSVVGLALGLSACVSHPPLVPQASFVEKIDVELTKDVSSTQFAGLVKVKTQREALRYGRAGAPKHVRIAVTRLHYKNPALSLLIGDSNNAAARVQVLDGATGKPHGEFEAHAIDTYAINGVIGAAVAIGQDRDQVDQRLAEALASSVLEKVYGSEVAKIASQRPYVQDAVPEPAPPADPVKPTPQPAKAKEPKTASAEGSVVR